MIGDSIQLAVECGHSRVLHQQFSIICHILGLKFRSCKFARKTDDDLILHQPKLVLHYTLL
jgi:hypothetical protein